MGAPVYLQSQVAAMLSARKYVRFNAWEDRWSGRESTVEIRHRFEAFPEDTKDPTEFFIETCHCFPRREVSFTLFGKMLGYPPHALCRYEVQNGTHKNPRWHSPSIVGNRVLHRHVYSERAIREGYTWDKCADVLGPAVMRVQQAIDRLTPLFLGGLNLEVHDPDVGQLFQR